MLGHLGQENAERLAVPATLPQMKRLLHAALSGTLQLLMVLPENFTESDVKTLLETLHGSCMKGAC